jgi:hypothetical protein
MTSRHRCPGFSRRLRERWIESCASASPRIRNSVGRPPVRCGTSFGRAGGIGSPRPREGGPPSTSVAAPSSTQAFAESGSGRAAAPQPSSQASEDYFVDGMTESLIISLAKIGAMKVIARSSVMGYKGSSKPLRQIARELKVDTILEGSITRSEIASASIFNLFVSPPTVRSGPSSTTVTSAMCSRFRARLHRRSRTPSRSR